MPTIELREPGSIGSSMSIINIGAVLAAVPEDVRTGAWVALHWWAVGADDRLEVQELETKTEAGLSLTTPELEAIGRQLLQLIEGIVAAYETERPRSTDMDLRTTSRLVVQAVDSSYWRVSSQDPEVIDGFRKLGADVTDVEDRPIPANGSSS